MITGCTGLSGDQDEPGSDSQNSPDPVESETQSSENRVYYVGPDGDDRNSGAQSDPLATVSEGIERAHAGETIWLQPGEYRESIRTVRSGRHNAPITLTGPSEAILRPPVGSDHCIRIDHSHIHVTGLSINGLLDPKHRFEDYEAWAKRCVLITPNARYDDEIDYLRDIVIEPSRMGGCSRPMVRAIRLRDASIGGFKINGPAGMQFDPRVENHEEGRIREVVYIGTPEVHRNKPFYRWDTLDRSQNIRVHHIDNSGGHAHNELVDIKLGTTEVTVEYCTDRNSVGGSSRNTSSVVTVGGNANVIRWNDFADCNHGIRFGAWTPSGDLEGGDWAKNNLVYGNRIADYTDEPIYFWDSAEWNLGPASPDMQKAICNNRIGGNNNTSLSVGQDCKMDLPEGNGIGHASEYE